MVSRDSSCNVSRYKNVNVLWKHLELQWRDAMTHRLWSRCKLACSPRCDVNIDANRRWSPVIPATVAGLPDTRVNAYCTHSHCRKKPDVGGFKWVFWPVEKGLNFSWPNAPSLVSTLLLSSAFFLLLLVTEKTNHTVISLSRKSLYCFRLNCYLSVLTCWQW